MTMIQPPRRLALLMAALAALSAPAAAAPPRPLPLPLFGVTVDDIGDLDATVAALAALPRMPTTRLVFDDGMRPAEYAEAVDAIRPVSYVMGEIVDSQGLKRYSLDKYKARTAAYLRTLGRKVDLWEIGNEVNGEWTGKPKVVAQKVRAAYKLARAKRYRTALTLYYNEGCVANPAHEMFTWAERYLPGAMRGGLDFVFVSYYEEDCNDLRPDWPAVFARLARLFPNAGIGFGETGTSRAADKADYLNRYYRLAIPEPRYVGGYFWWYFKQDMVPSSQPLWRVLGDALR